MRPTLISQTLAQTERPGISTQTCTGSPAGSRAGTMGRSSIS